MLKNFFHGKLRMGIVVKDLEIKNDQNSQAFSIQSAISPRYSKNNEDLNTTLSNSFKIS